jgi:uncharacterized membrane protein
MDDRNPSRDRLLDAVVVPHRSLSPTGFGVLLILLAGLSFAAGIAFLLIGAWPVLPFFGLDVLLVCVAFRASYCSGRSREEILLTRDELVIRRVAADGRLVSEIRLNPYWVRLETERDSEGRVIRLRLASHGTRHAVADSLGPTERASLATALSRALQAAQAG